MRSRCIIAIAALLMAGGAKGEGWTLGQCIDYALEHNIQLKQQVVAAQQSEVEISAAQGQLFPSLSFATNQNMSWRPFNQQFVNVSNGTMTTTSSEVNYNGTYGLQAQWTVWNGGRNRKNVERSRLGLQQAECQAETTALTIQEQIMQYYTQILYQAEAVRVNKEILEGTLVQLERAKTMYEVGSISKADLAQMQAQASQDEYNVTNAVTTLEQYKLQLKQVLEIVDDDTFDVATPDVPDSEVMAVLPDKSAVYATALAQRPEIQYSQTGIKAADLDIDIAKRGYWPTLSMNAGINTSNSSGMEDNFAAQLKRNLSNSIGVTISVPIFDNRQNKTNVAKARLARENSELELASAQKTLYSDIEGYWLNARNAQQQFLSARANVASMQESYDLVSEQFKVGLKDIVDLTTGKNNLIQAEQQLLQAKYTALLNLSLLKFYGGEELPLKE